MTQKEADVAAFKRVADLVQAMDFDDLFPLVAEGPDDGKLKNAQDRVVRILNEWSVFISRVD